ncbi:MAG: hypothetical protein WAT74_18380 [Flavobacteriales bacterium]
MSLRAILLSLSLLPLCALGQTSQQSQQPRIPAINTPLNATTLAVLRANQPKSISWEEWMRIMQSPDGPTLYPLRVTQAMLDTLDGREMDLRFRYMMVKDK